MTEKEPQVVESDLVEAIVAEQLLKSDREDLIVSCGCGGCVPLGGGGGVAEPERR